MFKHIVNCIYPTKCISCNEFTKKVFYICDECLPKFELLNMKTCKKCGLPKEKCECNKFYYHFDGVVSPFLNASVAKKSMYNFKFHAFLDAAEFFAKYMAQFVEKRFENIDFDVVVAVPMTTKSLLRRGYNQAEILAKLVSKNLKLKHYNKALKKIKETDVQHSLNMENRWSNLRNAYKVKNKNYFKEKTVLLVDDIKTTGATLDECTRMLKLAGAEKVYCVTGLITE